MANWLSKALDKVKKSLGFKDVGSSEEKCPLKETGLIVVVEKEDLSSAMSEPVSGVIVDIEGKSPFNKKTNADGIAAFKPVEPDTYKIKLTLPGTIEPDFEKPEDGEEPVALGDCPVHIVRIVPLVDLKVRVVLRATDRQNKTVLTPLDGVKLHIEGPDKKDAPTPKTQEGWALFEKVKAGEYTISVKDLGSHKDKYRLPGRVSAAIAPGETEREVTLDVRSKAKLRIVLIDKEEKPISGKAWELLSPIRATGKTGGNGLIEVENIRLENASGSLKVDMGPSEKKKSSPAPKPAAPPASGTPPYPGPIEAEDFKDKDKDQPASGGDESMVEWSLSLRLLEDMESDAGIKERLHNLGFNCDAGSDAAATTRAVKGYQRVHMKSKTPSGKLADVKPDVKKWHDKV